MITEAQIIRVRIEYERIAKEALTLDEITGALYSFGSELATLRLFRAMPTGRQGYSAHRECWYFAVDVE